MIPTVQDALSTLYVLVGVVVGVLTVTSFIRKPWSEKAKKRRQQKQVLKLFMNGDPGIKGLIDAIVPGPERVLAAEKIIQDHAEMLKKQEEVQKAQGTLLETVATGLNNLTDIVVNLDRKMTHNGDNTNDPGDVWMRMAKSSGAWLSDDELKKKIEAHLKNNDNII